MLEKIYIKNICSISETELSFIKGNYQYRSDNVLGNLVNPIAIYGHNGSGKTSFLEAIREFILIMFIPPSNLGPFVVNNILFEKYVKDRSLEKNIEGTIKLYFSIKDKKYEYGLIISRINGIVEEYLKDENYIFNRTQFNYLYKGNNYELTKNDLLISTLRSLASSEVNDSDIQNVYKFFTSFVHLNLQNINLGGYATSSLFSNSKNIFNLLVEKSDEVKQTLKDYKDFPIYSIKKIDTLNPLENSLSNYLVQLEDEDNFKVELPFNMISTGMRNNSILLSILFSIPQHSVLFIDELELALHPSAIESFLNVVKKKKVQLVFSSHNTNILTYLRPDQIYFSKWKKGFSRLLRLSDIYPNIREVNNIEKMYLNSSIDDAINNE